MLDVVDTVHEGEKKRKLKTAYKFKQRSGVAYGDVTAKLKRKNDKKQAELDARSKQGFLQDDLIMLWMGPFLICEITEEAALILN